MSWEPAWVPDGRGGFRRTRSSTLDEEGELSQPKTSSGSWEPAWVPDGRGGFRRTRAASEEDGELTGEEEGEIVAAPPSGGTGQASSSAKTADGPTGSDQAASTSSFRNNIKANESAHSNNNIGNSSISSNSGHNRSASTSASHNTNTVHHHRNSPPLRSSSTGAIDFRSTSAYPAAPSVPGMRRGSSGSASSMPSASMSSGGRIATSSSSRFTGGSAGGGGPRLQQQLRGHRHSFSGTASSPRMGGSGSGHPSQSHHPPPNKRDTNTPYPNPLSQLRHESSSFGGANRGGGPGEAVRTSPSFGGPSRSSESSFVNRHRDGSASKVGMSSVHHSNSEAEILHGSNRDKPASSRGTSVGESFQSSSNSKHSGSGGNNNPIGATHKSGDAGLYSKKSTLEASAQHDAAAVPISAAAATTGLEQKESGHSNTATLTNEPQPPETASIRDGLARGPGGGTSHSVHQHTPSRDGLFVGGKVSSMSRDGGAFGSRGSHIHPRDRDTFGGGNHSLSQGRDIRDREVYGHPRERDGFGGSHSHPRERDLPLTSHVKTPHHHHHHDPRDVGFDPRDPRDGGFDPRIPRDVGFDPRDPRDLREGGFDPRDLRDLRDGGFDPRDPRDPRDGGFDPRDLRDGGFDPREPRDPRDPRDGGFDLRDPRDPRDPRDGGFDPRDPRDPRDAGFDPRDPRDVGFDRRDPRDGGFGPRDPREGGFDPRDPRDGGFDPRDPRDPRDGGFDPRDLRDGGFGGSGHIQHHHSGGLNPAIPASREPFGGRDGSQVNSTSLGSSRDSVSSNTSMDREQFHASGGTNPRGQVDHVGSGRDSVKREEFRPSGGGNPSNRDYGVRPSNLGRGSFSGSMGVNPSREAFGVSSGRDGFHGGSRGDSNQREPFHGSSGNGSDGGIGKIREPYAVSSRGDHHPPPRDAFHKPNSRESYNGPGSGPREPAVGSGRDSGFHNNLRGPFSSNRGPVGGRDPGNLPPPYSSFHRDGSSGFYSGNNGNTKSTAESGNRDSYNSVGGSSNTNKSSNSGHLFKKATSRDSPFSSGGNNSSSNRELSTFNDGSASGSREFHGKSITPVSSPKNSRDVINEVLKKISNAPTSALDGSTSPPVVQTFSTIPTSADSKGPPPPKTRPTDPRKRNPKEHANVVCTATTQQNQPKPHHQNHTPVAGAQSLSPDDQSLSCAVSSESEIRRQPLQRQPSHTQCVDDTPPVAASGAIEGLLATGRCDVQSQPTVASTARSRMGSYSSLADSSTMPMNITLAASQQKPLIQKLDIPSQVTVNEDLARSKNDSGVHRPSGCNSHSSISRIGSDQSFRTDRGGDYFGPGPSPGGSLSKHFSPNSGDRGGRAVIQAQPHGASPSSPSLARALVPPSAPLLLNPVPKKTEDEHGDQPTQTTQQPAQSQNQFPPVLQTQRDQSKQQTESSNDQIQEQLPLKEQPQLRSLRPPNFRNNDPRFKQQQQHLQKQQQAQQEDLVRRESTTSVENGHFKHAQRTTNVASKPEVSNRLVDTNKKNRIDENRVGRVAGEGSVENGNPSKVDSKSGVSDSTLESSSQYLSFNQMHMDETKKSSKSGEAPKDRAQASEDESVGRVKGNEEGKASKAFPREPEISPSNDQAFSSTSHSNTDADMRSTSIGETSKQIQNKKERDKGHDRSPKVSPVASPTQAKSVRTSHQVGARALNSSSKTAEHGGQEGKHGSQFSSNASTGTLAFDTLARPAQPEKNAVAAKTSAGETGRSTVLVKKKGESEFSKTLATKGGRQSKQNKVSPLLTSSLGDANMVERAELAVQQLSEVVSNPSLKADEGDKSQLPTTQIIMKAVAELDKRIKETQKESNEASEDRKVCLDKEQAERERQKKQLEEEEKRKLEELQRLEEERKQQGILRALEEKQALFDKSKKKALAELEEQILQAKEDERRRCFEDMESQIAKAGETFDKDIAKVRRDLEKAKNVANKVEAKVSTVEAEYSSMVEVDDEKGALSPGKASQGGPPPIGKIIETIHRENKRKAAESQVLSFCMASGDIDFETTGVSEVEDDEADIPTDPKFNKTMAEWSAMTKQVKGLADALYSEPAETPYFEHNETNHALIGPSVKEYIRDKHRRLLDHWTQLAEEYDVRRHLYDKQQSKLAKKGKKRSSTSMASRKSILGDKASPERSPAESGASFLESSGRSSNNPYRRARRGNEVRSEYEQEQIIAEIAAKEAMERRITHGGSKLPRQIGSLERKLTSSYQTTFVAQKIDDPLLEEDMAALTNVWSDMEKCIFLDRFLQFPKDFRRIASFLRNKTTKDCVAFYYDSKQTVPYKGALKEHMMRRKRRGDYPIWDASIQAAISVGAVVTAGISEDKPVTFSLPQTDRSFATRLLHPLKRTVLDNMELEYNISEVSEDEIGCEETKWKSRKRGRDPLFSLDKEQTKFLRTTQPELAPPTGPKQPMEETAGSVTPELPTKVTEPDSTTSTPVRKPPQKWTAAEKKIFLETLEKHGRNWSMLSSAVGTKTTSQIKNFYYDYKKQCGKFRDRKPRASDSLPRAPLDLPADDDAKDSAVHSVRQGAVPSPDPSQVVSSHNDAVDSSGGDGTDDIIAWNSKKSDSRAHQGSSEHGELTERGVAASSTLKRNEMIGASLPSEIADFSDPNKEVIKHLLEQTQKQHESQRQKLPQSQPQIHKQTVQQQQQRQHLQPEQQQPQSQQHIGQRPQLHLNQQKQQSALQQLLGHHQQQAGHISVDDARRLLQRQPQSHPQQVLSNLLPWLSASQVLQAQSQLQQVQAAAAIQQQDGSSQAPISDWTDASNLHNILQLHQASQSPYGVNPSNPNNHLRTLLLSAGGLGSTAGFGGNALGHVEDRGNGAPSPNADITAERLGALAGAHGLLGFGANSNAHAMAGSGGTSLGATGNSMFRQTPGGPTSATVQSNVSSSRDSSFSGVSEALSLLARAIPRNDGGSNVYGGASSDGGGAKDCGDHY